MPTKFMHRDFLIAMGLYFATLALIVWAVFG